MAIMKKWLFKAFLWNKMMFSTVRRRVKIIILNNRMCWDLNIKYQINTNNIFVSVLVLVDEQTTRCWHAKKNFLWNLFNRDYFINIKSKWVIPSGVFGGEEGVINKMFIQRFLIFYYKTIFNVFGFVPTHQ